MQQEFEFNADFYKDKNGEAPIKNLIDELLKNAETNKEERNRVKKLLAYINALERWGTRAGLPYVKHIEGDIWELRPLNDRVFFFFWKDKTFVLLHHFLKKTRKTPKREIDQAKRNMKEHLERSGENE